MATVSFDEKVVVTDPAMIARMRHDLDETPVTPAMQRDEAHVQDVSENSRKWALKFARSKN